MLKATQELFNDNILNQAVKLFGGDIKTAKDLGGFEAFVYEIEKDNKAYILKITHTIRRTVDYILGELEFVNFLAERGLPTARAVPSLQNKYVETIGAADGGMFLVYLFEKAEGRISKIEDWTDDLILIWGETTGMMHRLTKEYQPSKKSYSRHQWHTDDIFNFEKYIPPSKQETISNSRKIIDQINEFPKNINSYGLIHGDLHQWNFFMHNGSIIPFDFDDCEYNYLINDIAIPLFYTIPKIEESDPDHKEAFAENFLFNFLKGYRKENSIDKEWILKIPHFLLLRTVIFFTLYHQIWAGEQLNEKQQATLDKICFRINNNSSIVEIDYHKFV